MDWSSERYVRLYIRDTADWMILPWQSRALLPLLLRKMDRTGSVDLGKRGREALGFVVGLPNDVAHPGLDGLLEDGCIVSDGTTLICRNFVAAQTTRSNDAIRQADSRNGKKTKAVTPSHQPSPDVTASHPESPGVTACHSSGTERSGASGTEQKTTAAVAAPLSLEPTPERKKRAVRERVLSPIVAELTMTIKAATNVTYPLACWDVLETALAKGDLTPEDARVVVAYASTETFWRTTNRLDPSSLFRAKTWPALLAKGRASKAPTHIPARDGTERRVYNSKEALEIE